jgi:hypothetical protein
MQLYADVTRRPISLLDAEHGPALGSAIHAAVAAGAYPDIPAAAAAIKAREPGIGPWAARGLRGAVAYAFERPALLGGTIGGTIALGLAEPPPARVVAAARAAAR